MAHVESTQKGEVVWLFNEPGQFEYACLLPGHFEAGMKGVIEVVQLDTINSRLAVLVVHRRGCATV